MKMNMIIEDEIIKPVRAHETDAGLDLKSNDDIVIPARGSAVITTGVKFEIPDGYYGKLESKSGLNFKFDIVCLGGVIDSSYRGEVMVKLYNMGNTDMMLKRGDKCVQIVFMKHYNPELKEVISFDTHTMRGENGFGSTGK